MSLYEQNKLVQQQINRRLALRAFNERGTETLYDYAAEYDQKAKAAEIDEKFTSDLARLTEARKNSIDQSI